MNATTRTLTGALSVAAAVAVSAAGAFAMNQPKPSRPPAIHAVVQAEGAGSSNPAAPESSAAPASVAVDSKIGVPRYDDRRFVRQPLHEDPPAPTTTIPHHDPPGPVHSVARTKEIYSNPAGGFAGTPTTVNVWAKGPCTPDAPHALVDLAMTGPDHQVLPWSRRQFTSDGDWSAAITVPADAAPGNYEIGGHCVLGDHRADFTPRSFAIAKTATKPQRFMSPPEVAAGSVLNLKSVDPCPSKAVSVQLIAGGDMAFGSASAVPDAAGNWTAQMSVPPQTHPGNYQLYASCENQFQYVSNAVKVTEAQYAH